MTFDAYHTFAKTTTQYAEKAQTPLVCLLYTVCGLAGEAGEISNKAKKIIRDATSPSDVAARQDELIDELGDVLWYLAMCAHECGTTLNEVARRNVAKLADRKARGVLGGAGDKR